MVLIPKMDPKQEMKAISARLDEEAHHLFQHYVTELGLWALFIERVFIITPIPYFHWLKRNRAAWCEVARCNLKQVRAQYELGGYRLCLPARAEEELCWRLKPWP